MLPEGGAPGILFSALVFVVLTAVRFYDQPGLGAGEVHSVFAEYFLPGKAHGTASQKAIPEPPLFFGHVPAQLFCQRNKLRIVLRLYAGYLRPK